MDKNAKKKKEKDSKKTKGKKSDKEVDVNKMIKRLEISKKQEYRVFEFGNYPERKVTIEGVTHLKPKGGCFRLRLPADADWSRPTKGGEDKDKDKK